MSSLHLSIFFLLLFFSFRRSFSPVLVWNWVNLQRPTEKQGRFTGGNFVYFNILGSSKNKCEYLGNVYFSNYAFPPPKTGKLKEKKKKLKLNLIDTTTIYDCVVGFSY